MHVAMVFMDGAKMSKSLGNLVFVDALRREWDPRAIRLAILENTYRREWEWTSEAMPRARKRLDAWSTGTRPDASVLERVRERLDDDLDTPGAVSVIDEASALGLDVRDSANLLGVVL
jgi:L-cysteine:1D-myo-inositol 2-amino-2-deoxy-alpha-D-glucopyranoside ligase